MSGWASGQPGVGRAAVWEPPERGEFGDEEEDFVEVRVGLILNHHSE